MSGYGLDELTQFGMYTFHPPRARRGLDYNSSQVDWETHASEGRDSRVAADGGRQRAADKRTLDEP